MKKNCIFTRHNKETKYFAFDNEMGSLEIYKQDFTKSNHLPYLIIKNGMGIIFQGKTIENVPSAKLVLTSDAFTEDGFSGEFQAGFEVNKFEAICDEKKQ